MKRAIAKYLIDSRINSGKFVDLEEARSSLPAWVRSMLSNDQDVRQYWELCCLLDSRLKDDAKDFCKLAEAKTASSWSALNENQPVLAVQPERAAASNRWVAPALVAAASLLAVVAIPRVWSSFTGESVPGATLTGTTKLPSVGVQSQENSESLDVRPLLATASAGRTVFLRLSQVAGESFTVIERSAEGLSIEESLPTSQTTEEMLRETREGWKSSVKQAVGLLTLNQ